MVRIQSKSFDPGLELTAFSAGRTDKGAIVSFTGHVRDFAPDSEVQALILEHYSGYTETEVERIAGTARKKWPDTDISIIHRYGHLQPGEPIVQVLTASPHRAEAFSVAQYLMDYLKTGAPFWKKEIRSDGEVWIEPKASDYETRKNWEMT